MNVNLPIKYEGGVNKLLDPTDIADNEVVKAQNLAPKTGGKLAKRKGSGYVADFPDGPLSGGTDAFELYVPRRDSTYFAVGYVDISGIVINMFGVSGETALNQAYAYDLPVNPRRPSFFEMGSKLYVVGADGPTWYGTAAQSVGVKDFDVPSQGFSTMAFEGVQTTVPRPKVAAVYRERAVYGDLGAGFEDRLMFSDPFDPLLVGAEVLTANGRSFTIGNAGEGRIVALVPFSQAVVGAPAQSALLVLKERAAYIITGEPNLTTETTPPFSSLVVNRININAGCVSAATVVRTPRGVVWASEEDVWLFAEGSLPRPVGAKIRPLLQQGHASLHQAWHAVYHDGFYRLAIPSAAQNATATGKALFQPMGEQWWLDLRADAPQSWQDARWWGPQVYRFADGNGTTCMATEVRPGKAAVLYTARRDAAGDVPSWKLFQLEQDVATDPGGDVLVTLVSKEHKGDVMTDKLLNRMELNIEADQPVTISAQALYSGGHTIDSMAATVQAGVPAGEPGVVSLYPGTERRRGKTVQLKLADSVPAGGNSAKLELGDINLNMRVIPRRP